MEEIAPGRFSCPECPERFETLGDKKRHRRATHSTLADLEAEQRADRESH